MWGLGVSPRWRVIGIVGIIAMAILAIILASPHVEPLQSVDKALGLVQVQTIYVPVNHTVVKYVNQTVVKYVYVNQTVPVYVNRTVYVYVSSNASAVGFSLGTCHLYSLVFSNGSIWTLGYWMPPSNVWNAVLQNNTIFVWLPLGKTKFGIQAMDEPTFYIIVPGEYPGVGMVLMPMLVDIPSTPQPNWVNMIYMGDWPGVGQIVGNFMKIENGSLVFAQPDPSMPPPTLPLSNSTTMVLAIVSDSLGTPLIVLPCNWTIIVTRMTPQQALTLPAPMGIAISKESHYVVLGNYNYDPYGPTWGYNVWNTEYPMQNVTNLPWPIG